MSPNILRIVVAFLFLAKPGYQLALSEEKVPIEARSSCLDSGGICTEGEGFTNCAESDGINSVLGCKSGLTCCWKKTRAEQRNLVPRSSSCSASDGSYTVSFGQPGEIGIGSSTTNYNNNEDCTWQIVAANGNYIVLTFNYIDLEYHYSCNYDAVEVFDENGNTISGKRCGNTTQQPIYYQGSSVRVTFTSDGSVTDTGFSIQYSVSTTTPSPPEATTTTTPTPTTEAPVCSGNDGSYTVSLGQTGEIGIGSSTTNYNNNEDCTWQIVAANGNYIVLNFNYIDLEYHYSCNYDAVEVFDENGNTIGGKRCGNTTQQPIYHQGSSVRVTFTSDGSVTDTGFSIQYSVSTTTPSPTTTTTTTWATTAAHACSGNAGLYRAALGQTGQIGIGSRSTNYNNNEDCTWQIVAEDGNYIVLNFTFMAIEFHPTCIWDSVEILNADGSSIGGKRCGYANIGSIYSQGSSVLVIFTSDEIITDRGFSLQYSATTTTPNPQSITSPTPDVSRPFFRNKYKESRAKPDPKTTAVTEETKAKGARIQDSKPPTKPSPTKPSPTKPQPSTT